MCASYPASVVLHTRPKILKNVQKLCYFDYLKNLHIEPEITKKLKKPDEGQVTVS